MVKPSDVAGFFLLFLFYDKIKHPFNVPPEYLFYFNSLTAHVHVWFSYLTTNNSNMTCRYTNKIFHSFNLIYFFFNLIVFILK